MAMIDIERKKNASLATQQMLDQVKKRKKAEAEKESQKVEAEETHNKKKIKKEWKFLQDSMLKHLAEKMRVWRNKVTPETTAEIKELLQAADAGVKAQYWELTHGADSETGAAKAAEKAIVDAGQFADLQTKQMVAKKASVAYLEKEKELKKTIKMLTDAKKLTGPIDKNSPNKYLSGVTERMRKMIQE